MQHRTISYPLLFYFNIDIIVSNNCHLQITVSYHSTKLLSIMLFRYFLEIFLRFRKNMVYIYLIFYIRLFNQIRYAPSIGQMLWQSLDVRWKK